MSRPTDDVARGAPSLSRLAWLAQRPEGAIALRSLQSELRAEYGPELEDAIRRARRRARSRGGPVAVVFAPTMERAYRRKREGRRAESYPGEREATLRFYRTHHWPFTVTSSPHLQRATAVVVWDSDDGLDVHGWAEEKRRTWRASEEKRSARLRRRTMNDPAPRRSRR